MISSFNIYSYPFKTNMIKKVFIFLCLRIFIFVLLILAFGWQVLDQTIKFVDKRTTMTSRFVAQIDKAGTDAIKKFIPSLRIPSLGV
jgi:hypothetical protein